MSFPKSEDPGYEVDFSGLILIKTTEECFNKVALMILTSIVVYSEHEAIK
jgi:hypothetical protein